MALGMGFLRAYEVSPGERGEATCAAFPQYSYDVYVPSSYSEEGTPSPVIYTMSFNPNGMVSSFEATGEALGIIVIGIKGVENGRDWRETAGEFYAVMRDVRERLHIDPTAQFTAGMSGGAWNAYDATKVMRPHLAGVFAMGGWLGNQHGETDRFLEGLLVSRSNGANDVGANGQLDRDRAHLSTYGVTIRDWSFPGDHEESPPSVQQEALRWMLDARAKPAPTAKADAFRQAVAWRQQLFAGDLSKVTAQCLHALMNSPRSYHSLEAQSVLEEILADYQSVGQTAFADLPSGPYVMDYLHYMAWIGKHTGTLDFAWSAAYLARSIESPGSGLLPTDAMVPPPPPIVHLDLPSTVAAGERFSLRANGVSDEFTVHWHIGNDVREGNNVDYQLADDGIYEITAVVRDAEGQESAESSDRVRVGDGLSLVQGYPKAEISRGLPGAIHTATWHFETSLPTVVTITVTSSPDLEVVAQEFHEGRVRLDYRSHEVGRHTLSVSATDGIDTISSDLHYETVATEEVTFVGDAQPLRWFVPNGDLLRTTWMLPKLSVLGEVAFHDGINGVGYDRESTYGPWINTDVRSEMADKQALLYLRIPFEVAAPEDVLRLSLTMNYDDAYVAYLNGTPIVERGMAADPSVDSEPFYYHSDSLAVTGAVVDLTSVRHLLEEGTNLLAIAGLNESRGSSDFLIAAQLKGQVGIASSASSFEDWIDILRPDGAPFDQMERHDDPDRDGHANIDEYLFGSHPWKAASRPTLRYAQGALTFHGRASQDGRGYVIEQSSTLGSDWEPTNVVLDQEAALAEGVVAYRAVLPSSGLTQFYRVRALQEESPGDGLTN